MRVNGRTTIVGVMPEGLKFPDATDLWMPFKTTHANQDRSARIVRVSAGSKTVRSESRRRRR